MQNDSRQQPGAYRDGDSFLHRLDPRLKILLLLGLLACLFSASGFSRLLLCALLWLLLAGRISGAVASARRMLVLLRWLLLFTLLLHLLLTPGRTLFGTSWLSYDGLLRGLQVDGQLLLAVWFSLLLGWTTRPTALALGLTGLLAPLQRLRLPIREAGGLVVMVLHFVPLIQSEVGALPSADSAPGVGWWQRLKRRVALIEPLLFRLVDRADLLAREMAAGGDPLGRGNVAELGPLGYVDLLPALFASLVILLLWML